MENSKTESAWGWAVLKLRGTKKPVWVPAFYAIAPTRREAIELAVRYWTGPVEDATNWVQIKRKYKLRVERVRIKTY